MAKAEREGRGERLRRGRGAGPKKQGARWARGVAGRAAVGILRLRLADRRKTNRGKGKSGFQVMARASVSGTRVVAIGRVGSSWDQSQAPTSRQKAMGMNGQTYPPESLTR